ncbi:hypothetical protein ACF1AE_17010 [Streptomyces sp. NPDC014986]|uniref:hypothetical protein n=1 Tax=Streptomyces sp. NPDC014986 TaxID=3364934 RepID=UPI0036F8F344
MLTEVLSDHPGRQLRQTEGAIERHHRDVTVFAWLTRYKTRRRHSANGHLSPNKYERRHRTAKLTLPFAIWDQITGTAGLPPQRSAPEPAPGPVTPPARHQTLTHPTT